MNINVTKEFDTDVLVIGGGPAGVCAAISSARAGAKTLLVEQGGFCGGMATRGLVGPFMTCYDATGERMIIRGIFEEIVERMVERGYAIHPKDVMGGTAFTSWIKIGHDHVTPFEAEGLKLVLDEMLLQAQVKVLYHTSFVSSLMDGDKMLGAYVHSKSGMQLIKAKVIVDCTGDGDVAVSCGEEYEMGNSELGIIQPATMFFHISNVDTDKIEEDIAANKDNFYRKDGVNYRSLHWRVSEAAKCGDWTLDRVSIGLFRMPKKDEWCINTSRIMGVDSTDNESLTNAEVTGRMQADEILKFFRKYVPGCADARLKSTASHVGIRESRHIKGIYRLTADDLLGAKVPFDSVFIAANSVDVHGRFGPKSNEYVPISGSFYGVPYRCLVPEKTKNLLLAGRCVSADSTSAGAIRVMPPCMAMGQAAGIAAAMALNGDCITRNVDIEKLRENLKNSNVVLE